MGIAIISHGDTDGICSAALVFSRYNKADIKITQPHQLSKIISNIPDNTRVYVLDLAADTGKFDEVFSAMLDAVNRGVKINYIDHHPVTKDIMMSLKSICNLCRIDTTKSCSMMCLNFNPKLEHLSIIGGISDRILYYPKLNDEASILSKGLSVDAYDIKFKVELVRFLADGKMPSENKELLLRNEEANRRMEYILNNEKENIVIESDKYMVYKFDEKICGMAGSVGGALSQKYNKVVFLLFPSPLEKDKTVIVARESDNSNYDLSQIVSFARNFGGVGGGHFRASSGEVNSDKEKIFIEYIQNYFSGK